MVWVECQALKFYASWVSWLIRFVKGLEFYASDGWLGVGFYASGDGENS